jgi:hypothetical protein
MTKTLSFASSREWCDSGHRIAFSADASGRNILLVVSFSTLERFGTIISSQDALRVFGRNRPTIQGVASEQYGLGKVILDIAAFDHHGSGMAID